MTIIISGSLAHDRIMDFPGYFKDRILPDQIHALNVSFSVDTLEERRGGTAGNIAYTLALLGEPSEVVASVGEDYRDTLKDLHSCGVGIRHTEIHTGLHSPTATIITDQSNNQITGFFRGALGKPTSFSMKNFDPADTLLVIAAGNHDDMLRLSREARDTKIPFIVDSGQETTAMTAEELKTLMTGALFCSCNDYEYSIILDRLKVDADAILTLVSGIAVTYGGKGSLVRTRNSLEHIPACSVDSVVDPTGAGDAYRAGFVKGIVSRLPLGQIGRVASTAASFAIEAVGTQGHSFTFRDFKKRYETNYSQPCPL